MQKRCAKCLQIKPLTDFYTHKTTKDRHRPECKECCKQATQENYAAQIEVERANGRAYYAKHAERVKNRQRKYAHERYTEDKEGVLLHARLYYAANVHRIRARIRAQYAANPAIGHINRARHRAHKAACPKNDLTLAQWIEIKTMYDHCCVYCGRQMERLTQDHLTPLSKGGAHTYSNVVPACQSCNSKKGKGNVLKPVQPLLCTIAPAKKHRKSKE